MRRSIDRAATIRDLLHTASPNLRGLVPCRFRSLCVQRGSRPDGSWSVRYGRVERGPSRHFVQLQVTCFRDHDADEFTASRMNSAVVATAVPVATNSWSVRCQKVRHIGSIHGRRRCRRRQFHRQPPNHPNCHCSIFGSPPSGSGPRIRRLFTEHSLAFVPGIPSDLYQIVYVVAGHCRKVDGEPTPEITTSPKYA